MEPIEAAAVREEPRPLSVLALGLALRTQVHPTLILLGGAAAGAGLGALPGASIP